MYFSQTTALIIMFLVSFLWGSWFQAVKHTGDYPIYGFLSWMYLFSIIIVWSVIGIFHETMIPEGILEEVNRNRGVAVLVILCGAVYAVGMQLQLMVVGNVGLILSSSITTTCSILSGIILSGLLGGISENTSMLMVLIAALFLIAGTIVCQAAGVLKNRETGRENQEKTVHKKDIFLLMLTSAVMVPFYSIATAVGVKTDLRPDGFSSLTCMGLLSVGALAGTCIYTGFHLTREKKWQLFWNPGKGLPLILGMAFIAACCHFGGNVLQAFAVPVVSAVIAAGIGYSFGMWSYLWGILYGEFRGAGKKTFCVLGVGILCFFVGIILMTLNAA